MRGFIRRPLLVWIPADEKWRCSVCMEVRDTQHNWDQCARASAARARACQKHAEQLEKMASDLLERVIRYAAKEKSA